MPLFHLVYVSSAVIPFSSLELIQLLEVSRRKNVLHNITGLLLYRDGNFMQMLEGEEAVVRETHACILRDPRHRGSITLLQQNIAARAFSDWSMGFRDLDSPGIAETVGYSDFLNDDWFGAEMIADPNRALQLLFTFRSGLR